MRHGLLSKSFAAVVLCTMMAGYVRAEPPSDAQALHVLNRLGYGPAPGDLAHVRQVGIDRYIAEQLHPERLPLPVALQQQIGSLGSTHMSQRELIAQFREAEQSKGEG